MGGKELSGSGKKSPFLNLKRVEKEAEQSAGDMKTEKREKWKEKEKLKRKSDSLPRTGVYSLSFLVWLKVIVVNVIIVLFAITVYHFYFSPRIAIVDLTGYLTNLRDLYAQGRITEDEARAKLNTALDIIQKESGKKIILDARIVLSKSPNVEIIKLPELPQPSQESLFGSGFNSTTR